MECKNPQADGGRHNGNDEHIAFQVIPDQPQQDLGKNKITWASAASTIKLMAL